MNYIDGDAFLANVFIELIRRKKLEISIEDLIKLEYYYLESLENGKNNVLENSVENILSFVSDHEGYLKIEESKIFISNEEELSDILSEYTQVPIVDGGYRKAVKRLINTQNKSA